MLTSYKDCLFALLRLISADAGDRDGFVVGEFRARGANLQWCQRIETREHMEGVLARFEALWREAETGEQTLTWAVLGSALARWLSHEQADARAGIVQDFQVLGRALAKSAHPGFRGRAPRAALERWLEQSVARATVKEPATGAPVVGNQSTRTAIGMVGLPAAPIASAPERARWTSGSTIVRLVKRVAETHDVNTFEFEAVDGADFAYLPGQSATLTLQIEGEAVRRTYTISSSPSRPERLHFTIKRVPGGLVSNWLADNAEPGMEIDIRGPGGKFSIANEKPAKVLLLSGGSGVTPMLSMSRYCHDLGLDTDVVFWHGARTPADLICADELQVYARRMRAFRAVYCMSGDDPDWKGLRGYFCSEALFASVPDFEQRTVYLCGPVPFMEAAKGVFRDAGFDMSRFHFESFGGGSRPKKAPPVTAGQSIKAMLPNPSALRTSMASELPETRPPVPRIQHLPAQLTPNRALPAVGAEPEPSTPSWKVTVNDTTLLVATDVPLLDALEDAGIDVESSCRSGSCGSCRARCTRGKVTFDNAGGLDPDDESAGYVLLCVGNATSDIHLEL